MFLLLIAGSMLHAMFSSRFDTKPGEDGSYFIDRDGTHFRYILNYLRTGELIVPNDDVIRRELLAEAKFYEVEGMIKELQPTPSADPIPVAVVQPFKDSVILSSSQGQTLMNWLKNTPGFSNSDELLLYRASRDGWYSSNFHSCCDNKGQQLQWSKVEITYLEDILSKVGIVSSKHWSSSLLIVFLKFLTENYDKNTQIVNANGVFEKA